MPQVPDQPDKSPGREPRDGQGRGIKRAYLVQVPIPPKGLAHLQVDQTEAAHMAAHSAEISLTERARRILRVGIGVTVTRGELIGDIPMELHTSALKAGPSLSGHEFGPETQYVGLYMTSRPTKACVMRALTLLRSRGECSWIFGYGWYDYAMHSTRLGIWKFEQVVAFPNGRDPRYKPDA